MKKLVLVFLLSICSNSLFANVELDSLNFIKTKKVIQKEEEIAKAYKKYLLQKGSIPTEYNDLKDFLPKGFEFTDSYYRGLKIDGNASISRSIQNDKIPLDNIYFSNKLREHTKAPNSSSDNIQIALSNRDLLIYQLYKQNPNQIVDKDRAKTDKSEDGKFYVENGILHYFHKEKHIFTLTDDVLVSENIEILDKSNSVTSQVRDLVQSKNGVYAGQKIFHKCNPNNLNCKEGEVNQYLNLQSNIIRVNSYIEPLKLLMKIVPSGAGLLLNGDIYMWGDNSNYAVGLGVATNDESKEQINTTIKVNSVYYDDDKTVDKSINTINTQNQLSTVKRTKFIDLFFDYKKGLCAISTNNDIYCNGKELLDSFGSQFEGYKTSTKQELLYRHNFFTPEDKKVKKIFIFDNTYLVLTKDGFLYYWGDNKYAWAASETKNENITIEPQKVSNITNFKDIAFIQHKDKRKLFALSSTSKVSYWGNIKENENCLIADGESVVNICAPREIKKAKDEVEEIERKSFSEINSSIYYVFAKDTNDIFYKIDENGVPSKITDDIVSNNEEDKEEDREDEEEENEEDNEIISFDYTSNAIVWVDNKNKLKGKLLTEEKKDKNFGTIIDSMSWLKIKVVNEHDAMCGLTTNSELYCWGDMRNSDKTSSVVPLFNTNQYAEDEDFMFGDLISKEKYYKLDFPTFISGFNYDVEFNKGEDKDKSNENEDDNK